MGLPKRIKTTLLERIMIEEVGSNNGDRRSRKIDVIEFWEVKAYGFGGSDLTGCTCLDSFDYLGCNDTKTPLNRQRWGIGGLSA
ncbi:hypothetical protein GOBAR_AA36095 [Gossypium barbadense]|uniref:Uncharacterized protein n=1 Tax=Gossypium barbadense TaxID=3634 RepID=A0A2P5W0K7_GOSBA|nr:hypothetical protein GOBAR_AA36095 [Gossypium barbadense]